MNWRRLIGTGAAGAALLLAACGESSPASSGGTSKEGTAGVHLGTATVTVAATDAQQFSPSTQTAHVGDIIEWNDNGSLNHTVTFDTESALSDLSLQPGSTWQVKFTVAGTYTYHCTVHAGMNGTITVK